VGRLDGEVLDSSMPSFGRAGHTAGVGSSSSIAPWACTSVTTGAARASAGRWRTQSVRRKSVAPRLTVIAAENRLRFCTLLARTSPYDPMRGDLAEVRDRLIRIEEWGDRYWAAVANTLVALAQELNAAQGKAIDALPDLVYSLVRGRLANLAKKSGDPRVAELIDEPRRPRWGADALRVDGHPPVRLDWPRVSGWLVVRGRRRGVHRAAHRQQAGGRYGVDAADPARLWLLPGRLAPAPAPPGRHAEARRHHHRGSRRRRRGRGGRPGFRQPGRTQPRRRRLQRVDRAGPTGLGGGHTWSALSTNAPVLTYRQTEQAETVAKLAGTERVTEGGADYDTDNRLKRQGVARRQHAFKVNLQMLRTLGMGEFVLISAGHYAKVAAALPRLSFGLPALPAVQQVTAAIASARVAAALPIGHRDDTTETVGDVPATRGPVRF
jgi:hypothetical protein